MTIERVPRVNFRPRHLITVYSVNIGAAIPLARDAASLDAILSTIHRIASDTNNKIGTIQSLTISSSRDVNFYRCLDAQNLGKIRETYPGLPSHTAKASVIAFYKEHLLNAFRATPTGDVFMGPPTNDTSVVPSFNIYNQIAPLIIRIDMYEPENPTSVQLKEVVRTVYLWDCWLGNSEIEFDITDSSDLAIVQEADIRFAFPITATSK